MSRSIASARFTTQLRIVSGASLVLLSMLSCSSSLEPRAGVTLLVTNQSCTPGPCSAQEILVFPSKQPNTPGGLWSIDLGTMTGAAMCITIPASAEFDIVGYKSNGTADTTKIRWTNADGAALGAQPPSGSRFTAMPSTSEFVPATSSGWRVTLPGGTQAVAGPACTL